MKLEPRGPWGELDDNRIVNLVAQLSALRQLLRRLEGEHQELLAYREESLRGQLET
jgi:hypothetical protein